MQIPALLSLDVPSLDKTPARGPASRDGERVMQTDWAWMLRQAARAGKDVDATLVEWNRARSGILGPTAWRRIRGRMEQFVHRRLYTVTLAEIEDALGRTDPPFGGTTKDDRKAGNMGNQTSPAPLNLILHSLMEKLDRVPLWQDFEAYLRANPSMFLVYTAHAQSRPLEELTGDWLGFPLGRALRFRLATAYNSFIRELHLRAAMDEVHGLWLTHHFMLDAVWKVDFLHGDTGIEIYLDSGYKDEEGEGRKRTCFSMNPDRNVLKVLLKTRHDAGSYDRPWLVDDSSISDTARRLRERDYDHRAKPRFF